MENRNTDISFKYTYSAEEQDEMSRLRKMDAKVTQKARYLPITAGFRTGTRETKVLL